MLAAAVTHNRLSGLIFRAFALWQLSIIVFPATQAHAVQSHGGAEGLVSHQIGHILFTVAMLTLLLRMKRVQLTGLGWYEFKWFLWLIILWNTLTFSGHWLREKIAAEHFITQNNQITAFHAGGALDLLFYVTRLDHLLLAPAFAMLLLAIRNWGRNG